MIENAQRKLCEQAADEQNLTKLKALTFETCFLLEAREWRLAAKITCTPEAARESETKRTRRTMPKP